MQSYTNKQKTKGREKKDKKNNRKQAQRQDNNVPKINNQVIKTGMKQNHKQTTNTQVKE